MKRRIGLLFISIFLLVGCSNNNTNQSSASITTTTTNTIDYTYIDEISNEDLKTPGREINSMDELIYAIDYMAFYRINNKVSFKLTDEFKQTIFSPTQALNIAYMSADLADVYAIHLDSDNYKNDSVITIYYSMSKDIATNKPKNIPNYKFIHDYNYEYKENKNDIKFPIDNIENKISCNNSEQLYYLAMNGYNPNPVSKSVAEDIYNKARDILSNIITESMDDFSKIKAVYDYLTNEIYYDSETAYSTDTYLVKEQAYYLEGVFLNKCAVCDGKAKAYALMLNMLGIDCYRLTGVNEIGYDHAWNVVNLDGNWYTSCTTYGEPSPIDFNTADGKMIAPNHNIMLQNMDTSFGDEWNYTTYKHKDIFEKISKNPFDVYTNLGLNCYNLNDVKELVNNTLASYDMKYKKIEFNYKGNDTAFLDELKEYVLSLDNANLLNPSYNDGTLYQIIFLGE